MAIYRDHQRTSEFRRSRRSRYLNGTVTGRWSDLIEIEVTAEYDYSLRRLRRIAASGCVGRVWFGQMLIAA
jgi:hypothetical protein